MSSMLTPNACIDMCYGEKPTRPVVQLVDVRLQGKNIRGVVSDGETTYFAVFNSAVAKMFRSESNPDGQVELYSAVRLTDYTISTISAETRVAVVMGMEMNESQPEGKIGEPVSAKDKGKPEPAELPAATPSKGPSPNGHSNTTPESSQQSRVAPAGFAPKPAARASEPAAPGRPTPIEALNPYSRTWTVRAKVTENGELRSITTKAGETMSVWEMVIADESGEIKCTAWRADAERFARIAELGSTYLVSRGQIKIANKRYSSTANNYEITLGADSAMVKQDVELKTFTPTYHFDFTPIADISAKPANSTVDVIGSVTEVGPVQNIVSKTGRELVKRVINLSDDSNAAIEVTLWGKSAETFAEDAAATAAVVAFKGLVVSEWNTRSLGAVRSTKIQMDPDLPQAKRVKAWADTGAASAATSLSINTSGGGSGGGGASMADDLAELLGLPPSKIPEKGAYATVGGYISRILTSKGGGGGGPAEERPIWYSACPKCNKKAIGEYGAGWSCESCGWSGDACTHRYIVAMQLIDASGTSYATAYQEQAIAIFGKTADELKAIKDADQSAFEAECSSVLFKRRTFRLRAKIETYQGVDRTKVGVVNSTPTTPITEGKRMLADIMKYDLPEPPAPEPSATPDEPMPQAAAADEAAEPAAVKA